MVVGGIRRLSSSSLDGTLRSMPPLVALLLLSSSVSSSMLEVRNARNDDDSAGINFHESRFALHAIFANDDDASSLPLDNDGAAAMRPPPRR